MGKNKVTEWESSVDGKNYKFVYQKVKGGHEIDVNGVKQTVKGGFKSTLLGFDEEFNLDGKQARLTIAADKEPDVAVNRVYLRSGKEYVQTPGWVLIFAIACLALIVLGGLIGALIGMAGSAICIAIAKKSMATPVKIVLCVVITAVTWAAYMLLAGALLSLF